MLSLMIPPPTFREIQGKIVCGKWITPVKYKSGAERFRRFRYTYNDSIIRFLYCIIRYNTITYNKMQGTNSFTQLISNWMARSGVDTLSDSEFSVELHRHCRQPARWNPWTSVEIRLEILLLLSYPNNPFPSLTFPPFHLVQLSNLTT